MATVKGQNLRIFINGKVVAAALQCSLSVKLNVQEKSTKDDEGSFARYQTVNLSWDAKVNGAVTNDPTRNDPSVLEDYIGQTVQVQLALASGEKNSDAGDILVAGDAILSDVSLTAQNRARGTYDIVLTGCKNLLYQLKYLCSSEPLKLVTADGYALVVAS